MALENTEQLLSLIERSRLIKPAALEKALETISRELGKLPDDPTVLLGKLVDAKLITPWQSDKLVEGRYKGFLLGNYKLLGHLGTGGMSSVYLAEHIHMQRRAAIKVLPQNRVDDSSYLERFYLEATATSKLDHRNIVNVYDVDSDGNNHFIAMEFIDGYDLQELVEKSRPLPPATVVEYIRQAAEGLAHAHERGMVHRDIKPANLLVNHEGTVKILDMGLARLDDETEASLTIAHGESVLGTADYLAPEQAINSHDVDARADIYSLGCTMYYLLTGRPPFPEGTLAQRLMKHQTEEPKSILAIRPDVPTDLVAICQKMMAKNRDNRFESAGIISETMGRWLLNHGKTFSTGTSSDPSALRLAGLLDKQEMAGRKGSGSGIAGRSGKRFGRGFLPGSSVAPGMLPEPRATGDTASGHNRDTVKGPVDPSRHRPTSSDDDELLEMKPLDEGEERATHAVKPKPVWKKPEPAKPANRAKPADTAKQAASSAAKSGKLPGAGKADTGKLGAGQPGTTKPTAGDSGVARPSVPKQGPTKQGPAQPAQTANRQAKQPPAQAGPAKPAVAKPGVIVPASARPVVAQPEAFEPTATKPAAAKPTGAPSLFPELDELLSSDVGGSATGSGGVDLLGALGAQADRAPPTLRPFPKQHQPEESPSVLIPLLIGLAIFALLVTGVVIGWTLAGN